MRFTTTWVTPASVMVLKGVLKNATSVIASMPDYCRGSVCPVKALNQFYVEPALVGKWVYCSGVHCSLE